MVVKIEGQVYNEIESYLQALLPEELLGLVLRAVLELSLDFALLRLVHGDGLLEDGRRLADGRDQRRVRSHSSAS